ncbi:MAG TPA: VanZ family protein [Burkholderiales bacterium]|nr:VanZ family protein [Burkholderiales bacterium]
MTASRVSGNIPRVQNPSPDRVPGASEDTGARLGFALFGYMLGVTLIITLMPFRFEAPSASRILYTGEPIEVVANVLLFLPLGFFYRIARPRLRSAWHALAIGALVSLGIEAVQFFEPARSPSPLDVATNALGAWLGALAAGRVARAAASGGHLVGWLALQLPLMGLIYLLVPLLWIDSLSAIGDGARLVLAPLLAAFGAVLLGGMQRHYFAPTQGAPPLRTAGYAAVWFVAGAFPALANRPIVVAAGAAAAAGVCWWYGSAAQRAEGNRRFEVALLTRASPLYAAYLALIVLLPLRLGTDAWTLHLGFSPAMSHQREILRLLEIVAASTLAGYMLAELRGRTMLRYRDALPRLAGWTLALVGLVEAAWGFRTGHGASIARAALMAAASLYGGWLYYLQRAHVVRLLSTRNGNR